MVWNPCRSERYVNVMQFEEHLPSFHTAEPNQFLPSLNFILWIDEARCCCRCCCRLWCHHRWCFCWCMLLLLLLHVAGQTVLLLLPEISTILKLNETNEEIFIIIISCKNKMSWISKKFSTWNTNLTFVKIFFQFSVQASSFFILKTSLSLC